VPYTVQASPSNTGTNANLLGTAGEGIPTVLVSLPIKNMHSAAELLSLTDAEALVRTVAAFACSGEIAEVYGK
jgi:endoglucanase